MSTSPATAATLLAAVDTDALVRLAKADREALGRLYDRYYPLVFRYSMRRLFVRAVAEDVTAEVFLHVATHIPRFAGRTHTDFRCWVCRIASNEVNATLRKRYRQKELLTQAL